jgi:hypothetical protein
MTYVLVAKNTIPANVSVSCNVKTTSSQPMGLTNTGKKRKSEPQLEVRVSTVNPTPTQDDEEAPPLPKKKRTKTSVDTVESSQPSATTTTTMERNNHGALSNVKRMDNSSKKRPGDDTFVNANPVTPAHPAKKAKVDKVAALNRTPLRRSGKITWVFKRHQLTEFL